MCENSNQYYDCNIVAINENVLMHRIPKMYMENAVVQKHMMHRTMGGFQCSGMPNDHNHVFVHGHVNVENC